METSSNPNAAVAVFQLRADQELLRQIKDLAAKSNVSANRYLVDAIKEKVAKEKEQEWKLGFEAMGRDPDMDAEYMLFAGHEVVFGS